MRSAVLISAVSAQRAGTQCMAGRREKSKPRTRCDWLETEMQADRAEGGKVLVKAQKRRRSSADTPEHRRYVDLASQLHNNHFQKPQLSVSRAVLGLTAFNLPITTTNPEFCVPPNRISLRVNLVMMYKCTALKPTVYFPFGPTYRYRLIHPCFSIFGRFVEQCNHLVPTRRFGVNLPTAVRFCCRPHVSRYCAELECTTVAMSQERTSYCSTVTSPTAF